MMKKILFMALLIFIVLVTPALADTCYRVVEFYSPDIWGSYHLLAYTDQTFITDKGEWGRWGSDLTGSMMYFQYWDAKWDHPYLFLSGTKKAGFCQSNTGISGTTGRVGYYTLKKVKSVNCSFVDNASGAAEMAGPAEK
jgi:hypothetical protein